MRTGLDKPHSNIGTSKSKGLYERKQFGYPSIMQALFFDADEGRRFFERRCSVRDPAWAESMIGHVCNRSLPQGHGLTGIVAVAFGGIVNP